MNSSRSKTTMSNVCEKNQVSSQKDQCNVFHQQYFMMDGLSWWCISFLVHGAEQQDMLPSFGGYITCWTANSSVQVYDKMFPHHWQSLHELVSILRYVTYLWRNGKGDKSKILVNKNMQTITQFVVPSESLRLITLSHWQSVDTHEWLIDRRRFIPWTLVLCLQYKFSSLPFS